MTRNTHLDRPVAFRLCVGCFRAVPLAASELYCIACGQAMLSACPKCHSYIYSPEARFCGSCGHILALEAEPT